jgi:outer membrane protein assembly factor BamB
MGMKARGGRWGTIVLVLFIVSSVPIASAEALPRPTVPQDPTARATPPAESNYPRLGWRLRFDTGGQLIGHPQLAGETLLVQSTDDNLYALDAGTGEQRWRTEATGASFTYVDDGSDGGRVYLAEATGTVRALDVASGKAIWERTFDPAAASHLVTEPAVVDGIVYLGDSKDAYYTIRAFDAETGAPLWHVKKRQTIDFRVSVENGIVVVPVVPGDVWFLDAKTGKVRDRYKTGGNQYSSDVVGDGAVFVGLPGGAVDAIDIATGKRRWMTQLPTDPANNAVMTIFAGGRVYALAGDRLFAIDAGDGSILWDHESDDIDPVVTDDTVYATMAHVETNELNAIDVATGRPRWTVEFPGQAHVAATAKTVYVGVTTSIYAFDGETGRSHWRIRIGSALRNAPAVFDGNLFTGGEDGILYRFDQTESVAPPNAGAGEPAATRAEPLTTIEFSTAPSAPAFVGIWRFTLPAGADATLPAFAGPAAAYVDSGTVSVPEGIQVALNPLGSEDATTVDRGQTARLPVRSDVRMENAGSTAAELLVIGIVPDGDRPVTKTETGAGLELLAGGVTTAAFPHGVVLGMDRWTLDAGAALLPTLSLLPDVVAVESGKVDATIIPIGGSDAEAATPAAVSLSRRGGGYLPADSLRLVQTAGRTRATVLILEVDANYDVPAGNRGSGCAGRCLSAR